MLGGSSCASDNLLQSYSLGRAFYSERDLPESYAQNIFASLPRYRAPMICSRGNSNYTSHCFLLSIPAMILTPRWNKSNCLGTSTRAGALPSWPITIDYASWFQHFGQAPTAISSTSWPVMYSSSPLNW